MSISTIYRDRLRSSLLLGRHTLEIDLRDLLLYNEELGQTVQERPGEVVPLLESATTRLARQILNPLNAQGSLTAAGESSTGGGGAAGGSDAFFTGAHDAIGNAFDDHLPEVQVTLRSGMNMLHFRELTVGLDYFSFRSLRVCPLVCFTTDKPAPLLFSRERFPGQHSYQTRPSTRDRDQRIQLVISSDSAQNSM